jgi:NAD(P)H-hydrate epimerase
MAVPETITKNMVRQLLPARRPDSHKGTYGKVLVIAGSVGMAGAAALCAGAALRGGSGLVRVAVPHELFTPVHVSVPEATCVDRDTLVSSSKALDTLAGYDAIAIGPGLGTSENSVNLVTEVLRSYKGSLVIDADALNIISGAPKILDFADASAVRRVITPHPGEAGLLLGITAADVNADRSGAALALAERYGAVTLLKGHGTIVAVPQSASEPSLYVNPTGNPGMATAGSGDVLTGLILSLLGQRLSAIPNSTGADAALAGAYLHGLAGDIAAKDKGYYGLIASDIKDAIPYAIENTLNYN